jgi:eukaryotic-like serine/threonine-protein kinase
MTPERVQQIETLYHAALERAPAERAAFLNRACNDDSGLRSEVESLLEQNAFQDGPLDRPAFAGMGSLLATDGLRLRPGTQLGPYKIEGPLGQGGMGEVYRARDPRLKRDVAIKVSAERFSERFDREAKAIAALNHANICQIYDVGPNYLVMELIEGESPQGPMPVEQVERIALQIADALEAAHEKGITHRDLKPANIKIKPDGMVKVLDFGLAKVTAAPAPGETSPTTTMGVTEAGMILGTAAYMAPEQARGQKVDKRADIWSFGVVVWELLTGERLFQGESTADVLSKVLERDIDVDRVPVKFRRLLARCLDRNVKDRLRDIGEVRFLLNAPSRVAGPAQGRRFWPALAGVFGLAALLVAYSYFREEPPRTEWSSLPVPSNFTFERRGGFLPTVSPDGRHVVFDATAGKQAALWIRDLERPEIRMLPGTDGAEYPFWSPDSRSLGFFAESKLKRLDLPSGPVRTLCEVPLGRGGTWNEDNVIVFAKNREVIERVAAEGGPTTLLVERDPSGSVDPRFPWFLPDGRHFLYTARNGNPTKTRVYVQSIDAKPGGSTRREVLAADSNAVYVPAVHSDSGYLLYVRERTLMAQPFDAAKARFSGEPTPVAEHIDYFPDFSQAQFSASRNGVLTYTSGITDHGKKQLTWFDRNGKRVGTVGVPENTYWPRISPDGSIVATDPADASAMSDIWLHDLVRRTTMRLTFTGVNTRPVWSPDGSRIAFHSQLDGNVNPHAKAVNGIGGEETLDNDPRINSLTDWSRDGRYLIEGVQDPKTGMDVWVIPQFGDRKPFPYLNTEYAEKLARLSPDGQWLAYVTNESKRPEVYVQTFPEHNGKWQISTNGGDYPVWSRDGRELYFIGLDHKLMAVAVNRNGKSFQAAVPEPLFEMPVPRGPVFYGGAVGEFVAPFDVSKDGRFLIQVPVDEGPANVPITVVINWQAGLTKP